MGELRVKCASLFQVERSGFQEALQQLLSLEQVDSKPCGKSKTPEEACQMFPHGFQAYQQRGEIHRGHEPWSHTMKSCP